MRRLALLIDCENQSGRFVGELLEQLEQEFEITIKRAYGNWRSSLLAPWIPKCRTHNIMQVHQEPVGAMSKNAIDQAITVDAIELGILGRVEAICIVSGDSDFVAPIRRLREHGIHIVGANIRGASVSQFLVQHCDLYIDLSGQTAQEPQSASGDSATPDTNLDYVGRDWTAIVLEALEESPSGDGWLPLSAIGTHLRTQDPSFDARTFGQSGLRDLITTRTDLFEMIERTPATPGATPLPWIRKTQQRPPLDHRKIQW